jgi:hypothetical protein
MAGLKCEGALTSVPVYGLPSGHWGQMANGQPTVKLTATADRIMEYYRNMLLANVAWGTAKRYTAEWRSTKKPIDSFNDPEWAKKFHIWRMNWDESAIKLYVDNQLLNSVSLKETVNQDGTGVNPFRKPHYLLLNLAIGGDNGGNPSKTKFPSRFEVDSVRVYQR